MGKKIKTPPPSVVSASKTSLWLRAKSYRNTPLLKITKKVLRRLFTSLIEFFYLPKLRNEFSNLKLSSHAMQKVIDDCDFKTVLDVGSGEGLHANHFTQNLKAVTTIDFGGSDYFKNSCGENACIVDDFNRYEFKSEFDLVWCSHVLEHQLNVNIFLKKIFSLITPGGYLAITVPPSRATIVGGHLTNWNAGLLLYNLVLAGFDCREAKILKYGYNISVIVRKNIEPVDISTLVFDAGDIRRIKCFLPKLRMFSNDVDDPFDGDIWVHNW